MNTITSFTKQSENAIYGHLYEHIMASKIVEKLLSEGYIYFIDYRLHADTYDGIVVISIEPLTKKITKTTQAVLEAATIERADVKAALSQVSAEYMRPFEFSLPKLLTQMTSLHTKPWVRLDDTQTLPIDTKQTGFKTEVGSFGRVSKRQFTNVSFISRLDSVPYELKPLAVYLIQAISLIQIYFLYSEIKHCYDAGDEWAEYQDLVGYSHILTMPNDHAVSVEKLTKLYEANYQTLTTSKVLKKIQRFILDDIKRDLPYFTDSAMFAYSYQLMGKNVMKKLVTLENILTVLNTIVLTVRQEK